MATNVDRKFIKTVRNDFEDIHLETFDSERYLERIEAKGSRFDNVSK